MVFRSSGTGHEPQCPAPVSAAVHFLFLYIDLWILPFDRRRHRRVFRLSAGPGQRIPRVRSILNRVAPRLRKDKLPFGQFLPLHIRKFCHRDFSRPSCLGLLTDRMKESNSNLIVRPDLLIFLFQLIFFSGFIL